MEQHPSTEDEYRTKQAEGYRKDLRPGKINTLRLFIRGLARGGGPVRPRELRDAAETNLEKLEIPKDQDPRP